MKPLTLPEIIVVLEKCEERLIRASVPPSTDARKGIRTVIKQMTAAAAVEAAVKPKRFAVRADICTDDENVSGTVDAEDWLIDRSDEDLAYMCADTGGNETTDGLFWWFDRGEGDAWGQQVAQRVGQYTNVVVDMGFKVRFNEDDLHIWVRKAKPTAWKLYQKEHGDG